MHENTHELGKELYRKDKRPQEVGVSRPPDVGISRSPEVDGERPSEMDENVPPEVDGVSPLEGGCMSELGKLPETVSRTLDVGKTAHVEKGLYMEFQKDDLLTKRNYSRERCKRNIM